MNWPNLFVVGVAKAGTTTLHRLLDDHPAIQMSSLKEPHYFTENIRFQTDQISMAEVQEASAYLTLWPQTTDEIKYLGESSPSYAWEEGAAKRIHDASPQARIIIVLRDPIARAFSHYRMEVQAERENSWSFLKALTADQQRSEKGWGKSRLYLELGYYAQAISRFKSLFGDKNVLILLYEELFLDVQKNMQQVWNQLEVDGILLDPPPTLNKGVSGNMVNKALKKLPLRGMIPTSFKRKIQSAASTLHRAKPEREAVDYLLRHYQTDLKTLYDMGITYYKDYILGKYSYDIISGRYGS